MANAILLLSLALLVVWQNFWALYSLVVLILGFLCVRSGRFRPFYLLLPFLAWLVARGSADFYGMQFPVGLSFLLFSLYSLLWDWGRSKKIETLHAKEYFLYLLYFPRFAAGPIQRFADFKRQSLAFSLRRLPSAMPLLAGGIFLKFVVSASLVPSTEAFFAPEASGEKGIYSYLLLWIFAVEFYADFSAYTLLARGISSCLGMELKENFHFPYLAQNPQDFWQRWHITLSEWFRDYVHYPLFFLTKNLYFAIFSSFFLMALWHGFAWHNILLGTYLGLLLVAHTALRPKLLRFQMQLPPIGQKLYRVFSTLLCVHAIILAFYFLRMPKEWGLARWPEGLGTFGPIERILIAKLLFATLGVGLFDLWRSKAFGKNIWLWFLLLYLLVALLFPLGSASQRLEFLYFQF